MISVCMATYNGDRFIRRQLETILPQLGPGDELIISDDSSTDKTIEIIESFCDPRIRLFRNQTFYSSAYNFENALRGARGEIIFLSDQDDEWVEGWVGRALKELKEVSLVICDAEMVNANGSLRHGSEGLIYHGRRRPGVLQNLYRNGYIGCCCAFRREVLDVALPFPPKLPHHDWWLGLMADMFYSTRFIEDKLIRHRMHDRNDSFTGRKSTRPLGEKLVRRYHLAAALLHRRLTWRSPA